MIVELDGRAAVSLTGENPTAAYPCARMTTTGTPAADIAPPPSEIRLVVELKRNLGGMTMRALIGGTFVPGPSPVRYEVCIMADGFDAGQPTTCESTLGRPLVPGLPRDFADAAVRGLTANPAQDPLPPGLLRVDRAGHDVMGSSEAAFEQAAALLRGAFSATVTGADVRGRLGAGLTQGGESASGR
jgi:hypothetical protein